MKIVIFDRGVEVEVEDLNLEGRHLALFLLSNLQDRIEEEEHRKEELVEYMITTKTRKLTMHVDYEITDEGLVFTADVDTRWEIEEQLFDKGKNYYAAVAEVFEYPICNGLSWVEPEDVGALTNSVIFSDASLQDDGTYPDDAQFFWYPAYQIEDPVETLMNTGKVIFEKAN